MSGVLSATPGVPGPGAVPGKVFRSELNPVDFLHRAAYMYPEKIAVVDGERRNSDRDLAERSGGSRTRCGSAGLGKGDRVATLLFNSPAMLEASFRGAGGGRDPGRAQPPAVQRRGRVHPPAQRRAVPAAGHRPGGAGCAAGASRVTVIRCAGTGRAGDPYEEFLAAASPVMPVSWLQTKRRRSRSTTPPGPRACRSGAVHLPRRVPERAERGDRGWPGCRSRGASVDVADVPLQRLVLPVGRHRGGGVGHVTMCAVDPGARLGPD